MFNKGSMVRSLLPLLNQKALGVRRVNNYMSPNEREQDEKRVRAADAGKTALVLAGGGVAGIAFELGALHAINRTLVNRSVNDFDIYVGTSAGATVSALLASGFSPGTILKAMEGSHKQTQSFSRTDLLRINLTSMLRAGLSVPNRLMDAGKRYLRDLRDGNLYGGLWILLDLLPPSLYATETLQTYLHDLITGLGGADQMSDVQKELYVITTRLDTGQRVVFDRDSGVAVSDAVAASSAVPGLYNPVRLQGIDYIDGGIRGNASIDLAVEQGANTVICINPIVPHAGHESMSHQDSVDTAVAKDRPRAEVVSMQGVLSQVLRTQLYASLHYHIKHLRTAYPDIDFFLLEPEQNDQVMTMPNLMRYDDRFGISQRAFESITWQLLQDTDIWEAFWQQHDVELQAGLTPQQQTEVAEAEDELSALREMLQVYWPPPDERYQVPSPVDQLDQTLEQLDAFLSKQREGGV